MKCELKEFIAHRHCIHVIEVKDNWSVQLTQREDGSHRVSIVVNTNCGEVNISVPVRGDRGDMSIDCKAATNMMLLAIKRLGQFSGLLEDRISAQAKEADQ